MNDYIISLHNCVVEVKELTINHHHYSCHFHSVHLHSAEICPFSDTKIPSKNFLSSLFPILQTWETWEHTNEMNWTSIPSKMISSLSTGLILALQPGSMSIFLTYFPPKKFLTSTLLPSLGIPMLIGK